MIFLCFCSVLCLLCLCARLFICALWSPAGKGLTSWLSFVVSNCEFVTSPLVSWVGCGTWLYRLLIFAPLLTLQYMCYFYRHYILGTKVLKYGTAFFINLISTYNNYLCSWWQLLKWASVWDFQQCGMCDQESLGSACAYAQSDQSLS